MMHLWKDSLRGKLILLLTSVATVSVLIACAGLGAFQWTHARSTLLEQEYATAQITADSSAAALLFSDDAAASETLGALKSDPRIRQACLFDRAGHLAGSFISAHGEGEPCPTRLPSESGFTLHHLSILQPVSVRGSVAGTLYMDVSLAELNQLTVSLCETALLATLCASIFAFFLSSITERWVSGPILDLTRTVVEIARNGSSTVRARRVSDDEVGLLIDEFNAMLDRLHNRKAALREAHDQLELKILERTRSLQDEIAERKLVELDLNTAKQLAEEANRAKSSFLANMSHELRTPLNAIIGYSEILFEDAQDPSQAGIREDLGRILSSARHLLGVISDILDLSKIEAGQMKVHMEEIPVMVITRDVLPIAEVLVKNNQNTLAVDNLASGACARVDALRFRQCLLNLLSNACKFTQNGRITLKTEIRDRDGASWVVWSVRDTGVGIAPEHLPRLFQSFSQVDSSATRRHGGSGLGLCISQELCRAMDGWIEAESTLGEGSTFRIWLPLAGEDLLLQPVSAAPEMQLPVPA